MACPYGYAKIYAQDITEYDFQYLKVLSTLR